MNAQMRYYGLYPKIVQFITSIPTSNGIVDFVQIVSNPNAQFLLSHADLGNPKLAQKIDQSKIQPATAYVATIIAKAVKEAENENSQERDMIKNLLEDWKKQLVGEIDSSIHKIIECCQSDSRLAKKFLDDIEKDAFLDSSSETKLKTFESIIKYMSIDLNFYQIIHENLQKKIKLISQNLASNLSMTAESCKKFIPSYQNVIMENVVNDFEEASQTDISNLKARESTPVNSSARMNKESQDAGGNKTQLGGKNIGAQRNAKTESTPSNQKAEISSAKKYEAQADKDKYSKNQENSTKNTTKIEKKDNLPAKVTQPSQSVRSEQKSTKEENPIEQDKNNNQKNSSLSARQNEKTQIKQNLSSTEDTKTQKSSSKETFSSNRSQGQATSKSSTIEVSNKNKQNLSSPQENKLFESECLSDIQSEEAKKSMAQLPIATTCVELIKKNPKKKAEVKDFGINLPKDYNKKEAVQQVENPVNLRPQKPVKKTEKTEKTVDPVVQNPDSNEPSFSSPIAVIRNPDFSFPLGLINVNDDFNDLGPPKPTTITWKITRMQRELPDWGRALTIHPKFRSKLLLLDKGGALDCIQMTKSEECWIHYDTKNFGDKTEGHPCDCISFSPNGKYFIITRFNSNKFWIGSDEFKGAIKKEFTGVSKITMAKFIDNSKIILSNAKGILEVVDLVSEEPLKNSIQIKPDSDAIINCIFYDLGSIYYGNSLGQIYKIGADKLDITWKTSRNILEGWVTMITRKKSYIAGGSNCQFVVLYDKNGEIHYKSDTSYPRSFGYLEFTNDLEYLVLVNEDKWILLDLNTLNLETIQLRRGQKAIKSYITDGYINWDWRTFLFCFKTGEIYRVSLTYSSQVLFGKIE